jgi:phospholipid/cholesterol/gamma-HCH transport system substrate-binding protein
MRFRIRFAEQIVGVFILVALATLTGTLVLMGANQRWFAKNYVFRSEFLSGNGLTRGMPVKFRGFEIGKISAIELNDSNTVDVVFYVYDTYYAKVRPNSVLELLSSPLGIGGGLVLHAGRDTQSPPPPEGYLIPAVDTEEGRRRLSQGLVSIPKADDLVSSLLGQLDPLLAEVNRTVRQANVLIATIDSELSGAGSGPVSRLLGTVNTELDGSGTGPIAATLHAVVAAVERVNRVLDQVETNIVVATSEGVGRVLDRTEGVLVRIDQTAANLATLSGALADPTGLVPRLLGDSENNILRRIDASLAAIEGVVSQLQRLGVYVNAATPQITGLIEQGQSFLDQGNDVLSAAKNNPLLRGGVPKPGPQATTYRGERDVEF